MYMLILNQTYVAFVFTGHSSDGDVQRRSLMLSYVCMYECMYLRAKFLYELPTREIRRPGLHPQHKEDGEPIRSCVQGFENR